jgi:hypothetical protein
MENTMGYEYHGDTGTRLFRIYHKMRSRCLSDTNDRYSDYGGRGITICDEWLNSYLSFKDWALTNGYTDNLTIDRIDNNGNYEPSNCRWTTVTIQNQNQRKLCKNNTTGFRGVTRSGEKFVARIHHNGKATYIGTFETDIEASNAYDKFIDDNNLEHTKNEYRPKPKEPVYEWQFTTTLGAYDYVMSDKHYRSANEIPGHATWTKFEPSKRVRQ